MNGRMTVIARNWGTTIRYLIGGLLVVGISVLLFATIADGTITVGIALTVGVLGIVFVAMAVGGAGEGACPACSARLTGLSTGSNDSKLCEQCLSFSEGKGGKLWSTDPARVADRPLFGAELPEQFEWPSGCCVCGMPATRREATSVVRPRVGANAGLIAAAALTGGGVSGNASTRITVEVPHCEAHKAGASLGNMGGGKVRISFKSYPYLRAFCQRNSVKPA